MARMSAAKRIELGNAMIERWAIAGIDDDPSIRFVRDMCTRLGNGKGMSKRQRDWFDSAVLTQPPEVKNEAQVKYLRELAALQGMEKSAKVLSDFAYKLSRGWSLSEKQINYMNKLTAKAEDIRKNGVWQPNAEEKDAIAVGVAFARRYSRYYLDGCPGIRAALEECRAWLAGESKAVERWSAEKVIGLCKGDRKAMRDAAERWPQGSLVQTKSGQLGLVLSKPAVSTGGKPCLNLLIDSIPVEVELSLIKKERRKKVKAA